MTPQEKQNYIREKIMEARTGSKDSVNEKERFTLADVLLAIGDKGLVSMSISAPNIEYGIVSFIWEPYGSGKYFDFVWNLKADSLSDQTSETIDFIYELLK